MSFGRLSSTTRAEPMGEINMTPLIDVMLVLLVIFMVTAPLMSNSLKLDLPRSDAAGPSQAPKPLVVALDTQGRTYVGEQRVDREQLITQAQQAAQVDPKTEVQLRADRAVPYGQVAELIGLLQKAGLSRIAFVTDSAGGRPPTIPPHESQVPAR
jgi:biopolymer transport protein ExbD/biopolymer transport protein TolR